MPFGVSLTLAEQLTTWKVNQSLPRPRNPLHIHAAWKATMVLDMIERHGLDPGSICEVGCGHGDILVCLRQEMDSTVSLHGWDIDPQSMRVCQPKQAAGLTFQLGDVTKTHDNYDLLLILDVLEHVDSPLEFLRKAAPLAINKILHIPLEISVSSALRPCALQRSWDESGHRHYFCRQTALATLQNAGYTIKEARLTSGAVRFPGAGLKSKAATIARRLLSIASEDLAARVMGGYSLLVLAG